MGGLGGVGFPKFPTVFPKIAFEGFFTLSCKKNVQKFFAQKISCYKKTSFKLVLHFMFYKIFCISNPKSVAFQKLKITKTTGTKPISLESKKFQISIKLEAVTDVISKFHLNPSTHSPVAPFQKKLSFFSLLAFLIIFAQYTLFKFIYQ